MSSLAAGQTATGGYEPGKTSAQAAADYAAYGVALAYPAWQGMFSPVPLLDARAAGVRGVICIWTGLPDDEVVHQYNPFITPYPAPSGLPAPGDPGCPAVWAGDATGAALSRLAASGQASATLTLTADITAGAATETAWGWLKGSGHTGENIIINTHTDGPNAVEENGGLGLLALARYLASLPARQHDMYFALVTGHFQLPQFTRIIPGPKNIAIGNDATSVWMLDHPGIYRGPLPLYLGEGAPLYSAGLGTVSLCPMPTYLLQAGDAQHQDLLDLDKLDQHLIYGQILALARTIQTLDATAPARL